MTSNVMLNVFFHFCIISSGYSIEFDNFYVEKSGHSKVKPGEIAIVFYMTVANSGVNSKKIYSKNTKCCWTHPGSGLKYDCESMDLHGGIPVILQPSKTANITYLFTNLYPLDRVGQCVFHLWHSKNKIAHTVRFNTTFKYQQDSWLGSLYKKIAGDEKKIKVCDTMDEDPRRNCKPVNCVQKYNGKRNYFRKETKLCEPVHECYTSKDDDGLPTTAFDKDHNKCKSLIQKELTADEEKDLKDNVESHMEASQKAKFKNLGASDGIPIRCNHGKRVGEICVCDDGWKTDTSNVPLGDPKFVYNWCNVRTRKKPLLPYKQQKHFMIAGLSLTSFSLLVTWLWMIHRYIYPRIDEKEPGKMPSENNTNNNVHVWKKTNLLATSQLLKELADRAVVKNKQEQEDFEEENIFMSVKNAQKDSPVKGKPIQKGESALSFIKHSAKKLLPFRSLTSDKAILPPSSSRNNDISSVSLVQQPSITDHPDTTQENVDEDSNISGEGMIQQQSAQMPAEIFSGSSNILLGHVQQRKSSKHDEVSHEYKSNMGHTSIQQRSNSLPNKMSPEQASNVGYMTPQQRRYSLPSQLTHVSAQNQGGERGENKVLKDESHVQCDDGVLSSRIVASRTTRGGSTYTLTGPLLKSKRLSTSTPVTEKFSDSD